jgi:hypothetical protein
MPADVVEGAQCIVATAEHDDAFAGHRHVQAVAGRRHLVGASHTEPLPVEEPLVSIRNTSGLK